MIKFSITAVNIINSGLATVFIQMGKLFPSPFLVRKGLGNMLEKPPAADLQVLPPPGALVFVQAIMRCGERNKLKPCFQATAGRSKDQREVGGVTYLPR